MEIGIFYAIESWNKSSVGWKCFQIASFHLHFKGEDNDHVGWSFWIRIEIDGNSLQFNYFKAKSEYNFSDKLFEIFGTLFGIRRFNFTCAPDMKMGQREVLCANLCRTGLFEQEQLELLIENI